jgi:hypothetical protein
MLKDGLCCTLLANRKAPASIIRTLVDLGPQAAQMAAGYGDTPLHLALTCRNVCVDTASRITVKPKLIRRIDKGRSIRAYADASGVRLPKRVI